MVTGTSLFLSLFNNLAFFIVLVAIYGVLNRYLEKTTLLRQVAVGLTFGILAIACMHVKLQVAEGVIVDQRNTVITLCGAFGGPLSAVLCALMAGLYRISLGGAGALAGTVGVGLAALAGVIFFKLRDKIDNVFKAALSALVATIIILPGFLFYKDLHTGWELLKAMALPYGGAVYVGILFVGLLLAHQENSHSARMALKQSEKRLRESKQRLDLALDGANEGIWDWDLENNTILFDSRYYTISGYIPNEFPAAFEEWEKRVHPEDIDKTKVAINQHLSGSLKNYSVEFRFLRKDGDYMWILGRGKTVAHNEKGEPIRFTGTHADIDQRKTAEEEVQKLRNYLSNIIDSMPSILVGVDDQGRITQWNKQAERVTGLLSGDVKSTPIDITFPGLAGQLDNIRGAIQNREVIYNPKVPRRNDTETRYEDITIYPLIANGTEGAVIRIDDVTREKAMEDELNTSRKMEAIGLLAGGVAHDFNNMLAGIMGATELLGFYLPKEEPKAKKMHQMILDSSIRAADLTKQLLAFSRQSDKASTLIKLHDVINDTLTLLKSSLDRRIEIEVYLDAVQNTLVGDPSLLQNSFLNLCINASHAMPEGGLLKISTHEVKIDDLFCQSSTFDLQPGRFIELEVRDTGCGIQQENLSRIFEPFFTTKGKEGTGLGLPTVYGTVQQHGGAINVYSEVGRGTVFQILLPLTNKEEPLVKITEDVIPGSGCILIVDDEDIMRVTARTILENLGYTTLLAENGEEAVELFRKERDSIDLVLLDMIMPVMNGKVCFEQLRKINPDVKVVLSSGFSREEELQDMLRDGLAGLIRKPYLTSSLSKVIHDALAPKLT